ncbi:MAG: dTDP-glucose 4,6-dehydratase [Candidatus Sumerlaeota bacterium]|nr:dTDP-glucose 4,6-dehydratase [Candidatus Sumerlaeota bacterium]
MNLLVTGGAGFIGSNLVRHLAAAYPAHRIVVLDALTYAGNLRSLADLENAPNYHFVRGDIRDQKLVTQLLADLQIEGIIHLAAESHVDRSILGPEEFLQTNVMGTFALLEAARTVWRDGRTGRFHHVSTDEVYGSLGETGYFTETTPYAPNSPYSASKAASDHLVRAYHHTYGLDVVTTNCSNNYGPFQFPEKLIPLMIMNARDGKPLPVYGDGRNVRDWLYVQDHCEAIDLVLHKGTAGEVYNIGGNNERRNIDVVHAVCDLVDELAGPQPEGPRRRLITYVKDRPGHDRRYAIDATKIRDDLGWEPRFNFEDGLRHTIEWYLHHTDWLAACIDGSYRDYYESNYQGKFDG